MMKKNSKEVKKDQSLTPEEMMEIAILQEELNVLKKEHGIVEEKKGLAKFFDLYFNSGSTAEEKPKKERVLSVVNRRKYGWILVLTGWLGGHHFYAKRYKLGLLYLVFFWSGFPAAMAIVDWLIWLPKKPDENGNIEI